MLIDATERQQDYTHNLRNNIMSNEINAIDDSNCEWFEATTQEDQAALNLADTLAAMRETGEPVAMSKHKYVATKNNAGTPMVMRDGEEHIPCNSPSEAALIVTELNKGEAAQPMYDDANSCIMAAISINRKRDDDTDSSARGVTRSV